MTTLENIFRQIDADALGEFLRATTFKYHGGDSIHNWQYGCYSTFDFIDDAELLDDNARLSFWRELENKSTDGFIIDEPDSVIREEDEVRAKEATEKRGQGCIYDLEGYRIECCYYWDGDGTLAFRVSK